MAQIVPKLNLNKTPSLVENGSFIFAKNIRLDANGSIHRDYGVFPMSISKGNNTEKTVNYKDIFNRIISDVYDGYNNNHEDYYFNIYNKLKSIIGDVLELGGTKIKDVVYGIVGVISNSNEFYIFLNGTHKTVNTITNTETNYEGSCIIRYDEKNDRFYPCNCNWNWSGGNIYGCVINNLIGDKIINIGESGGSKLVPLKSINLNKSSVNDDESIYTQIPNIPLTNFSYADSFSCVIPNGVYQFFVRYKIRKDFYTDWFPASNEIFVGNKNSVITSFGSLSYTNTHRDSDTSFILSVEHLIENNEFSYESYQVGFILSHDDATYARAWKHFDFNTTSINFDYKPEDATEIEIGDFLKSTYGLYNVGNITSFKNKLYISNYTETDFNDRTLQSVADEITISLQHKQGGNSYDGNPIMTSTVVGKTVISGLVIDGTNTPFIGNTGLFNTIITSKSNPNKPSISEAIENALNNSSLSSETTGSSPDLHGIRINAKIDSLLTAKYSLNEIYKNVTTDSIRQTYNIEFPNDTIEEITINGAPAVREDILPHIYNTPRYLNEKCSWINNSGNVDDRITIRIARKASVTSTTTYYGIGGGGIPYDPNISDIFVDDTTEDNPTINRPITPNGGSTSSTTTRTFDAYYYQNIEIRFIAWKSKYDSNSAVTLINNTTLIPYQKYKFYIHFVKSTGEITNGYYCSRAGELEAPYMSNCTSVIYPKFSGITIPEGYSACFFSILHTKINSSTLFNIGDDPNNNKKEGSCIDINMMLIPGNKRIHIKQGTASITPDIPSLQSEGVEAAAVIGLPPIETYSGQYYYSSDSSIPRYFGADGVVVFDKDKFVNNKLAYVVNDYSISETDNIELVKCTPFLNENNLFLENDIYCFDDYPKMNLLGFICCITPLLRNICTSYYSDGSSVYYKPDDSSGNFYLDELSKYSDAPSEKSLSNFSLKTSEDVYIYSNYNLNYVTLSEEPKIAIKTFYNRPANSTGSVTESQENDSRTILLRLIPSQLMSDVYTLPSMYKTYIRKIYSKYTENEVTRFDNTIRSSVLYGDESKINVLTFEANDYYNIPTNKGIIVNMVAIGDAILVHTKDSMFKFSGSNTLQSSDGEVQVSESTPFDTGIAEMFGSEFGFAGLQNKTDYISTEDHYIFFDRDAKILYAYTGQGQMTKISDSIEKLFRHKDIKSIHFANDASNNRVFISIKFIDKDSDKIYPVTLSFGLVGESNVLGATYRYNSAFISLHDFYYHYSFNTKNNCYFLTSDNKDICYINKYYKGCYTKLELSSDKTYPQLKNTITITVAEKDVVSPNMQTYNINSYDTIVDIIINEQFEIIKTLNAVNWCGNKIVNEFVNIDENDPTTLLVAEDINFVTPCKYIRIYSDTCMTPLNPCDKRANDASISVNQSYKYPRFNQGFWSFNYFRNILNSNGHVTSSDYMSDNNSLIEGKYFVTRFIFDDDFKFESISLNYNNKIIQ